MSTAPYNPHTAPAGGASRPAFGVPPPPPSAGAGQAPVYQSYGAAIGGAPPAPGGFGAPAGPPLGSVPAPPATPKDMATLETIKIRTALVRAIMLSIEAGLSTSALVSCVIALKVLGHYGVTGRIVCGYNHMQGVNGAIPHAWVDSGAIGMPNIITDLCYAPLKGDLTAAAKAAIPQRAMKVYGLHIAFGDTYVEPSYDLLPHKQVLESNGAVTIESLKLGADNINAFLAGAPPRVAPTIDDVVRRAVTIQDGRLDLSLPQGMSAALGIGKGR